MMLRAGRHRDGCGRQWGPPERKSSLFARRSMRTRKAILPDAEHIHELICAYSGDGTLLPRTLPEICENVRDFVVLEDDGRIICMARILPRFAPSPWRRGRRGEAAGASW